MSHNILIIEDEVNLARLVKDFCEREGFKVTIAHDGFQGIQEFGKQKFDLVCLDIMMPNLDGWEVAKNIRQDSNVPIIILSALSDDEDILKGYACKVDDYVPKPYNPQIVIAKIKSLLARASVEPTVVEEEATDGVLKAGVIKIDENARKVFIDGEEKPSITKTEYDVLAYLVRNKGNVVTREQLLDDIWGMDVYVEDRIVDQYIKTLRKALGEHKYIKTVFGVGYRFEI